MEEGLEEIRYFGTQKPGEKQELRSAKEPRASKKPPTKRTPDVLWSLAAVNPENPS